MVEPAVKIWSLCVVAVCAGCYAPPQGDCDNHFDRLANAEEWAPVAALAGVTGKPCPPAYLIVVDDSQAELRGMGVRGGADEWFSGRTEVCGGGAASLSLIRVDGERMHPGLIQHELLHAAISCSTGGDWMDPDHTLEIWEKVGAE